MPVRTLTVYVLGDGTGLSRVLNRATLDVDRFVADVNRRGDAIGTALSRGSKKGVVDMQQSLSAAEARTLSLSNVLSSGLTKAVGVFGTAAVIAFGAAAAAAIPFDAAMRNVNTIANQTEAVFGQTEQAVISLSNTLPQTATQLSRGLYEIESSNFHAANGLHVLDVAAKAGSAGLSDTETAAHAITGALNAYGLSAASAGDVSDILFQTVNKGVVSFTDLAQNLGDFVGTAAAAKVPLQDVAAAYAAITLSGVPAAEAATSVNQLLTKLLKPTEALAALYKKLGYESGASALQQKGLQGVITDIGKATGGSAEQLVRMFNDIRAARGVLGLLSADGRNYQESVDAIANSQGRAGATQRAFSEQMKSTAAQLALLRNVAVNTGIQLGLKLLPPFNAFLESARRVGSEALPFLQAAMARVAPLFGQLFGVISDLARLFGTLVADAAPVVKILAELAGAVILGPLTLFLQLLHQLTTFLAQNAGIAAALGVVLLTRLLPSFATLTVVANRFVLTPIVLTLNAILTGAGSASTAVSALAASLTLANVAMAAAAIGVGLYTAGLQKHNQIVEEAKAHTDELTKGFDVMDTSGATAQLEALRKEALKGRDMSKQYEGFLGTLKAGITLLPFASGEVDKSAESAAAAATKYAELSGQLANYNANVKIIAAFSGTTADQVGKIAKLQNIDLTGPVEKSANARKQLIDYLKDLKTQDAITARAIASNADFDLDKMKELEDQIKKVVDAATSAFARDTDVLGQFDPQGDAKKVADAQRELADARSKSGSSGKTSLADEQRIARDRQRIVDQEAKMTGAAARTARGAISDQQALQRDRRKLADDQALIAAKGAQSGTNDAVVSAQQRLSEALAEQAQNTLQKRYQTTIATSRRFVQDINFAIQRGLDPNVVAKLLAEGPAKAEPTLQAILSDHSGRMIGMVNSAESEIAKLSGFVAEQARIAALAMNAPTDQYTKDMKKAMSIAAIEAASGGKATVEALARSLRTSTDEVQRIATEFGITLADAVQTAVDKHPPILIRAKGKVVAIADVSGRQGGPISRPGLPVIKAEGGPIAQGPFGRDAVLLAATRGEWIQPPASVQYYGPAFMEAVRTRTYPKFWDGGLVGMDGAMISNVVNVSGPRIVPVPVPVANRSSYDQSTTYNIDKVITTTPWELPAGPRTYSASKGVT